MNGERVLKVGFLPLFGFGGCITPHRRRDFGKFARVEDAAFVHPVEPVQPAIALLCSAAVQQKAPCRIDG